MFHNSHTPAPWFKGVHGDGAHQIIADDGRTDVNPEWVVAHVNDCMGAESQANARLIAKAPEMFEILHKVLRQGYTDDDRILDIIRYVEEGASSSATTDVT